MGAREQVLQGRNWIQKVVEWVPGFRGYYAKEHRRDADKLVREAAAARLKAAADALGAASAALVREKRLAEVARLQELAQRVASLGDRARTAVQGYAGFFDAVKVREPELDRLYEQDLALLAATEALKKTATGLDPGAPAIERLEASAREIESALDGRREKLVDLAG